MEKIYACLHRPTGRERMEFAYFYNPEDQAIYVQQGNGKPERSWPAAFWRGALAKKNYDTLHEASRNILDFLNAKLGAK